MGDRYRSAKEGSSTKMGGLLMHSRANFYFHRNGWSIDYYWDLVSCFLLPSTQPIPTWKEALSAVCDTILLTIKWSLPLILLKGRKEESSLKQRRKLMSASNLQHSSCNFSSCMLSPSGIHRSFLNCIHILPFSTFLPCGPILVHEPRNIPSKLQGCECW